MVLVGVVLSRVVYLTAADPVVFALGRKRVRLVCRAHFCHVEREDVPCLLFCRVRRDEGIRRVCGGRVVLGPEHV